MRREVWRGRPYGAWAGHVVLDEDDLLVLHMPEGSPLAFAEDFFGAPHPWAGRDRRWRGHGVLQLQRPGEAHAVWVFWDGPARRHASWYVNLQEPFRRTALGLDTQDLELDVVVAPDGTWRYKDDEELEPWIERGRWGPEEVAAIRAEGARVAAELAGGRRWWGEEWAAWEPDPSWAAPELSTDWEREPAQLRTVRLVLRPVEERDLPWYAALRASDGLDEQAAAARLADAVAHWREHGFGKLALELDGEAAGLITLDRAGDGLGGIAPEELDVGWYVLPHLWGRGLAPEAARAALSWLRREGLGPAVVYIRLGNAASLRVAEKLGLRRDADGTARDGAPVAVFREAARRDVSGL